MNRQEQKRSSNRRVRSFRKMLMNDAFFEKRFDIQEIQMEYIDGVIYKRYVFIFKHPKGEVIKKETMWYSFVDINTQGFHGLLSDYNHFIIKDMKWSGYDKVSTLSDELIEEYKEAYKTLAIAK